MRAPGIVRVLRDVSDFLGSSVHARDGPVAVTPEDYLAASGEALALNTIAPNSGAHQNVSLISLSGP